MCVCVCVCVCVYYIYVKLCSYVNLYTIFKGTASWVVFALSCMLSVIYAQSNVCPVI